MKKSLLALAVLSAFTGVASAQSSVTLSGIVDAGVRRVGTATGHDWNMAGSQSGYNSFTLSGREDLGGGMNAFFALNHRFNINNGATNNPGNCAAATPATAACPTTNQTFFYRQLWVGLGGGFGDVRLGRMLMPLQDMNGGFDPFATGTVGSTHTGGINATIRATNVVYYRSPNLGGLSLHAAIAAGEGQLPGEHGGGIAGAITPAALLNRERPVGFNVRYAAGPLNVGVAWDKSSADLKTAAVYGSFNFGAFTLLGQFEKGDNCTLATSTCVSTATGAEDIKNLSIGALVPLGPVLIRTGFVRVDSNLNNRDGSKFGFGGDYNLSKRTNLYATVGKSSGNRFTTAQKKAAFDVGVTHRF